MKIFRDNITKKKIIISLFCIIVLVLAYITINFKELNSIYAMEKKVINQTENMEFVLGGEAVGIKLLATGVLVMGVDREDVSLQVGDIILEVNNNKIETNSELLEYAKESGGKDLILKVNRQEKEIEVSIKPILDDISNEYKLGLWVKDSSAGVGTVTFCEKSTGRFASLGHGVTETDENYILPITSGAITKTKIYSIKKGEIKLPGELKGSITSDIIGDICLNTEKGIYGYIYDISSIKSKETIEILPKTKIKEKESYIYCTLDNNEKKAYKIEIQKVILNSTGNKNMIIKIVDEELLEKTGGIVQGMSGSPIVQDGKLVGAVTHVFLNDPTKGYGVFIENMIEDMCSME